MTLSFNMNQAAGDFIEFEKISKKKPFFYEGIDEFTEALEKEEKRIKSLEEKRLNLEQLMLDLKAQIKEERRLYRDAIDRAITKQEQSCSECVKLEPQPIDILSFDAGKYYIRAN